MAHMWVKEVSGEWAVMQLDGGGFILTGNPLDPVQRRDSEEDTEAAHILRHNGAEGETWLILAEPHSGVRINGTVLASGIRVLRDRDEVLVGGTQRLFFSSERLPHAEPFPGIEQLIFCPRCKQEIAVETMAVKCPQCRAWHHQSEEFPCWLYSENCALCDQPTNLDDSNFQWTPKSL